MVNLKKYFSIKSISDEKDQVVISVHADDPLAVAEYPLIQMNYKYITIHKYVNRHIVVLTIIHDDGTTWSWNWGSSTTIVCDECKELQADVISFIEDETGLKNIGKPYADLDE